MRPFYRVFQKTTNFDDKEQLVFEIFRSTKKEAMACFNYHKKRIVVSNLAFLFTEVQKIKYNKKNTEFINTPVAFSIKLCSAKYKRRYKKNV